MSKTRRRVVSLGSVMRMAMKPYLVEADREYPNLGIYGHGRGIFEKPPIDGRRTSARTLYRVRAGQFIYSKLFAFEGAYGVVPERFDKFYVSNEFPVFDCDERAISPDYLRWLFKRRSVWEALAAKTTGMGDRRQRVHPNRILEYKIPLPTLNAQREIVARLDAATALMTKRMEVTQAVDAEVAAALAAGFAQIVDGAPRSKMGDVAPLIRRPVEIDPRGSYPELGVRSFGKGLFTKPPLIGATLTWQKLFLIKQGDLVFSNIKAWEGAFAVAGKEHDAKVGSHRYLTCVPDRTKISAGFLWYYLQSSAGIAQIQSASPGSADRNRTLSQDGLKAIAVPLPSLKHQQWLDELQGNAAIVRASNKGTADELERLIPAMLDRVF